MQTNAQIQKHYAEKYTKYKEEFAGKNNDVKMHYADRFTKYKYSNCKNAKCR